MRIKSTQMLLRMSLASINMLMIQLWLYIRTYPYLRNQISTSLNRLKQLLNLRRSGNLLGSEHSQANPRHLERLRVHLMAVQPLVHLHPLLRLHSDNLALDSQHSGSLLLDNLPSGSQPSQYLRLDKQRRQLLLFSAQQLVLLSLRSVIPPNNHNQLLAKLPSNNQLSENLRVLVHLLIRVRPSHRQVEADSLPLREKELQLLVVGPPHPHQPLDKQHLEAETNRHLTHLHSADLPHHQLLGPQMNLHDRHLVRLRRLPLQRLAKQPLRSPRSVVREHPPSLPLLNLHSPRQLLAKHNPHRQRSAGRPNNLSPASTLSDLRLAAVPLAPLHFRRSLLSDRRILKPLLPQHDRSPEKTNTTSCFLRTILICSLHLQRKRSGVQGSNGGKFRNGYHPYSCDESIT